MSDLSFLDQIPDPIPDDQRPDAERARPPLGERREPPAPRLPPPGPSRAELRRRRWVALALSGAWLGTHVLVYGVRQDLSSLPLGYVAVQVGLPVAVAMASLGVALSPGKLGLGVGIGVIGALTLLGPLSFWLSALVARAPSALEGDTGLLSALVCFDITLVWSVLPLAAAAFALRRSFAGQAAWRSALVGAAAGMFSGAAMNLHCTNVEPLHIAFAHGLPVVLGALVGAFVLARWLRA